MRVFNSVSRDGDFDKRIESTVVRLTENVILKIKARAIYT